MKVSHSVYFFRTNLTARIADGREFPVYKLGKSTNVTARRTQFDAPCQIELIACVDLGDAETAGMVERFMLEYHYPLQRIRGTRERRTEWIFLSEEQYEHVLANLRQFENADTVRRFQQDMVAIRSELDEKGKLLAYYQHHYQVKPKRPQVILEQPGAWQ